MDKQKAEALLNEVEIVLADEEEYKKLLEQRGSSAQGLLDLLQALSVYPNVEPRLRSYILKTIVRLSNRSSLFPKCLSIQNVETVGQYAVDGGTFGEIWKGRIGDLNQTVCLKIVKVYQKSDVEIVVREFLREAIIWRQLEHPNVLPFLGLYFMHGTRICLISPWMENGNLIQYMRARKRAEVDHLSLASDIASGLAHLHSKKVVHADLKGVNVLVAVGGRACVADFGLSRIAESGELWKLTSNMSNMKCGTLRWMAPELLNPSQPSYESDVYAFACVCYEIYTGLRPFHHIKNDAAVLLGIIKGTRPLRPENTPELNDRVWSVIESCWTQEPSGRPTFKAVLQELREMSDCDLTATPTAPIDWHDKITASIWPNLQQQDVALETDEFISHCARRVRQKLRPRLSLSTNAAEDVQRLLDGPGAAGLSMATSSPAPPDSDAEELTTGVDTMLENPCSPTGVDEPCYPYSRPERENSTLTLFDISEPVRDIVNSENSQVDYLDELTEEGSSGYNDKFGDGHDEDYPDEVFINKSLLSHLAFQLWDNVPRETHVKSMGSTPYPGTFTGKDIVSTIQSLLPQETLPDSTFSYADRRRAALQVARSLQSQLFFHEVEWGGRVLQDGVEDVYMFLDDPEAVSPSSPSAAPSGSHDREGLPTGVVTMLAYCYVPMCVDSAEPCYAYCCPKRGNSVLTLINELETFAETVAQPPASKDRSETAPPWMTARQIIIRDFVSKEDRYMRDLDTVETVFINPLRSADPPIISPFTKLEEFIDDVFGNILDLRASNRRLLMTMQQREQQYVMQRIGDVFLVAASEFRREYPDYVSHRPLAEKRMREEVEKNPEFRLFLERASHDQAMQQGQLENGVHQMDLNHYLNRPLQHLQKYPVLLEAILEETAEGNPDGSYLKEAIDAMKGLQMFAQLKTFQLGTGEGPAGKWKWHDLVSTDLRKKMEEEEAKKQSIIFELIQGEMAYLEDLENIGIMYIQPLREANTAGNPIIASERLEQFIEDVFHNYHELHAHHKPLVEKLHQIQQQQHPQIRSVTADVLDAALNIRDAYMKCISSYSIAACKIDDEVATNPRFKQFIEKYAKHPDAHRLDMKSFINRPIPRLSRYESFLKRVMEQTPPGHEDRKEIPQVLRLIKSIREAMVRKVELWSYNSDLVFKQGERIDLGLLAENRSLIHCGKMLRQPEGGWEQSGWCELHVLLFNHYLVFTTAKEGEEDTKYHVNLRPILLDLLTLGSFTDLAILRQTGFLSDFRGFERYAPDSSEAAPDDSDLVYPLTLHPATSTDGPYVLYAESAQARAEWKAVLEEALNMRKVIQEANKVFEMETLSADTFLIPSVTGKNAPLAWNQENLFTGKVTCSVPFNTADGRGLVAIGCAEGVWIGFRHDPKSMRRVLDLKAVTQCAMLEEFGVFMVLADKALLAYHIEALVPTSPQAAQTSQIPQRLSSNKDIHFFSVGQLHGRTLVIYMKKKGLDSVFRALEPVRDKINERARLPTGLSSRIFRQNKSEWFRIYRDFSLPSESFDLIFLKPKIVILCSKGFEIMDLYDFKSVTIPQRDDPRLAQLAKRCDSYRPVGMFRSAHGEFLLCYDEFGLFINKHGDPIRAADTIKWEGTVERIALYLPYILLFNSRFIEVRLLETGKLVQVIPGNGIRCIWDGRADPTNRVISTPSPDRRTEVHVAMNSVGGDSIVQKIFQLVPTVPLYQHEPAPSIPNPPPPAYDDIFHC